MIKIVTDSTAYLPERLVQEHDIRIVPLYVHFGEEAFKDQVEISSEEFYARLVQASELPKTSQPSAGEFHQVFKELVDAGHEVITLTISSKLSGTWNSAVAAKEMLPDAPISVIDTLSTSMGQQIMVEEAIEAIAAGATRDEVVERVEAIKPKVRLFFTVDTLEYLAKGGRIGNAKAFLGTLLSVKPILVLQDGAIEPLEQVRSKRKAVARMLEVFEDYVAENPTEARVGLMHAMVPEEIQALAQTLQRDLNCTEPSVSHVGPVLGVHTGPGVVGVGGYS
jgi:DegV family protein with EDD domain